MSRAGVVGRLWRALKQPFRPPQRPSEIDPASVQLMGTDVEGNKYYGRDKANIKPGLKASRWVEAADPRQTEPCETPTEWEGWLRYRRQHPPTEEEIDRNLAIMILKQKRAQEMEEKDQQEMSETHANVYKKPTTNFPVFEEYELYPGEKAKFDAKQKRLGSKNGFVSR